MDKEQVLRDSNLKHIHLKMIDYLSRGDMAEARLVKRIARLKSRYPKSERYAGYTRENAWKVIPLLREQGFIDEKRYARYVFEYLIHRYDGLRRIRQKMLSRDIQPALVDSIIETFKSSHKQNLAKIIKRARARHTHLKEKLKGDRWKKEKIRQKMYAWLSMRGYSAEEVQQILSSVEK